MLFRNDDVSSDTKSEELKVFCELFDKYGFKLVQGITLYGDAIPIHYSWTNEMIDMRCINPFEENKEVVHYLQLRNDEIAIHGYKHLHYPEMNFDEATEGILKAKAILKSLFDRKIKYFIPPFNEIDIGMVRFCSENNLEVLSLAGEHLELLLDNSDPPINNIYRSHFWRFFQVYPNGIRRLDRLLAAIKAKYG